MLAILPNEVYETHKDSKKCHDIDVPVLPEEGSHSDKDGGKRGPAEYLWSRSEEEGTERMNITYKAHQMFSVCTSGRGRH